MLDEIAPLADGNSHADAQAYVVEDGRLMIMLPGGAAALLMDPAQLARLTR